MTVHEPATERAPDPLAATESELDNAVRYRASAIRNRGHVESHFLKANSPDGRRALWIKHTILAPQARARPSVGEVWAVAFDKHGERKVAEKRTFALGEVALHDAPFRFDTPVATLAHGAARGSLGRIRWDLRYRCPPQGFRPFPYPWMYTASFPRSKSLTPVPDSAFEGSFQVDGQAWELAGYRGAQGHNWGRSHAEAYAWTHANVFRDASGAPRPNVWFEALSGRVRLGPGLVTPFLTVAAICVEGALLRFDGPRALTSRRVSVDGQSFTLELRAGDAHIRATLRATAEQFAGLRYEDPDGRTLACLNTKLATGELTLTQRGRELRLHTDQAALEIGTRRDDHGVALLA